MKEEKITRKRSGTGRRPPAAAVRLPVPPIAKTVGTTDFPFLITGHPRNDYSIFLKRRSSEEFGKGERAGGKRFAKGRMSFLEDGASRREAGRSAGLLGYVTGGPSYEIYRSSGPGGPPDP